jgi:transcriptional regulator with XRE-family HTH domain
VVAVSFEELCVRLHIAFATLRNWEEGKAQPQRNHLLALARALRVPIAALCVAEEDEPAAVAQ